MPLRKQAKKREIKQALPAELERPIEIPDIAKRMKAAKDLVGKAEVFEARNEFENKFHSDAYNYKFQILLEYLQLERTDKDFWEKLARQLISEFIPGFQLKYKKTAGRKNKWDEITYLYLWHEVNNLLESGECLTALAACAYLAKHSAWKDLIKKQSKSRDVEKNLYEQYQRAQHSPAVMQLKKITTVLN